MEIKFFENRAEIIIGDGQVDVVCAIPISSVPKAILSSPIGAPGMVFVFEKIQFPDELDGVVSFVGHPATRALLEALGAVTDSSGVNGTPGRFDHGSLAIGEWFLAVPLANNQRPGGMTADEAVNFVSELNAIRCIRIA